MTEQGFEMLKVWQKAHAFMLDIHQRLLPLLPAHEKYGLTDQIRRSSKSIGANIAEGSGRFYYMDNVRFCYQARGSLDETINHLRAAFDLEYCSKEMYDDFRRQAEEIRRMLNGYISWLKTQKIGAQEPGAALYLREASVEYLHQPDEDNQPPTSFPPLPS